MPVTRNCHVILSKRPGADGEPEEAHFGFEECPYPGELQGGQILVRTCFLSVDPALRCLMNEDPGVDYLSRWELGERIQGSTGVGVVVSSRHHDYNPGDLVDTTGLGWPWALYFVPDNMTNVQKLDKSVFGARPSLALIKLVGLTALIGLWERAHVTPGANQTLVVSGASGATGSLVGQMGRLLGCANVVGICGSNEKCQWLTGNLGFHGAVNYKSENVTSRLASLCPAGVDIYFDNVGGSISDDVIAQMNTDSHVVLCGQISQYNKDVPYPPPIPPETEQILREKHITRERYLVLQYQHRFEEALRQLLFWINSGQVKYEETVARGLESAPTAFISLMRGGNRGKQIVHVSDARP